LAQLIEPFLNQTLGSVTLVSLEPCRQEVDLLAHGTSAHGHVLGVEFHVACLNAFG
jgi:hypothetical protein